jgi:hypothetical protein
LRLSRQRKSSQVASTTTLSVLREGLEPERYFGPWLQASVVFLKHQDHFIYVRITRVYHKPLSLEISEGDIAAIYTRGGKLTSECSAEIRLAVISGPNIQNAGTSAQVKGQNHWHGVFLTQSANQHQIVPQQNTKVILDLMAKGRPMSGERLIQWADVGPD